MPGYYQVWFWMDKNGPYEIQPIAYPTKAAARKYAEHELFPVGYYIVFVHADPVFISKNN